MARTFNSLGPRVRRPDIARAARTLGGPPTVELRPGPAETTGCWHSRLAAASGVPS